MQSPFLLITGTLFALGIFYATAFLSVILHELAHIAVLYRHRARITDVVIGYGPQVFSFRRIVFRAWPVGGECLFRSKTPILPTTWARVAVAGPLMNLLLAVVSMGILLAQSDLGYFRVATVAALYVNALFFFINTLPAEENDGFIFCTYLSQRFAGTALSPRQQGWLNTVGHLGIYVTLSSFVTLEIVRGDLIHALI